MNFSKNYSCEESTSGELLCTGERSSLRQGQTTTSSFRQGQIAVSKKNPKLFRIPIIFIASRTCSVRLSRVLSAPPARFMRFSACPAALQTSKSRPPSRKESSRRTPTRQLQIPQKIIQIIKKHEIHLQKMQVVQPRPRPPRRKNTNLLRSWTVRAAASGEGTLPTRPAPRWTK